MSTFVDYLLFSISVFIAYWLIYNTCFEFVSFHYVCYLTIRLIHKLL